MLQSPFLLFILSCLSCVSMAIFPSLGLLAAIVWGFALFLVGIRQSGRTVMLFFVLNLLVLYLSVGIFTPLLFYILAVGLPCTVMGMMAAEKKNYYLIRKTSLLMGVGGTILYIGFLYQTFGSDWGAIKAEFIQTSQTFIQEILQSGSLDRYLNQGLTADQIIHHVTDIAGVAVNLFPAFYFLQMILAIYFVLTLASIYAIKKGERWLIKKPLSLEQMPWQLSWCMIAGLAMAFWDYGTGSLIFYTGLNLMCIMAPIGFYFGCAVVSGKYYSYSPEKRRNALIIFFILCIFVAEILGIFLILLGVFDSVLDYRKLNIHQKPK